MHGARDFDIGGLAQLDDDGFQCPRPGAMAGATPMAHAARTRFFADGKFFTPDRKARLVAPDKPALSAATSAQFPFRLNTGRVRDQWHTMTRSGLSPRLGTASYAEPFVEVHPDDAAAAGLDRRRLCATCVRLTAPACSRSSSPTSQRRRSLFAPIHWSDETASCARVGELVTPANDPYSGQPEVKATPVAIEPVAFAYRGFALTCAPLAALPEDTWWARVAVDEWRRRCCSRATTAPAVWRARRATLFGAAEIAEYLDEPRGIYRAAVFVEGRLIGCLFLGTAEAAPHGTR